MFSYHLFGDAAPAEGTKDHTLHRHPRAPPATTSARTTWLSILFSPTTASTSAGVPVSHLRHLQSRASLTVTLLGPGHHQFILLQHLAASPHLIGDGVVTSPTTISATSDFLGGHGVLHRMQRWWRWRDSEVLGYVGGRERDRKREQERTLQPGRCSVDPGGAKAGVS